jgi:hypothetical protein
MGTKRIRIKGLLLRLVPTLEGETFREGQTFAIDGQPLPEKWSRADWEKLEVGSKVEFSYHVCYRISGVVSAISWDTWSKESPYVRCTEGEFEGKPRELERGSMGRYGSFEVLSFDKALVEPEWLFPKGITVPWGVYQSIISSLDGWEPFRQLSLTEVWQSVKYATDRCLTWSFGTLLEALQEEGNFGLPSEVRRVHNALKLAAKIKEHGWPLEDEEESPKPQEPELLNLWFDLESQKWIWLRPDSLFEDKLGLACAQFSREELESDIPSLALKLLFPVREPFFSVNGQVFESTYGPF